jgi:hypothetical protein
METSTKKDVEHSVRVFDRVLYRGKVRVVEGWWCHSVGIVRDLWLLRSTLNPFLSPR